MTSMPVLQPRLCLNIVGLGSSHFDRHYSGNHYCFLLLRVLRCFSSPGSLPDLRRDSRPSAWRVSPFGYLRIYRIFAPLRSFSQLVTSFIASESQGIHRLPLITFLSNLLLILQLKIYQIWYLLLKPVCQRTYFCLVADKVWRSDVWGSEGLFWP